MKRFVKKVVLVTGGASGIGLAAIHAFAREGAAVVVADVSADAGEKVAAELSGKGHQALFIKTDVSRPEDTAAMVKRTIDTFGRLDIAFNNAGIEGPQAASAEVEAADWERVIRINLLGTWLCLKSEIPPMLEQKGGVIVNMSSILGRLGFANSSAYTASKHGVIGLTKAAALEYAGRGLRINSVCPGFIETPMLQRAGILSEPEYREKIVGLHPLKRLGKPEEVAAAVLWLSSEEASFVTGSAYLVDGGYSAR